MTHQGIWWRGLCGLLLAAASAIGAEAELSLSERVREMVLDNGLRVVVVERHEAPVFFTLIAFRVGSAHELPGHSGLSHFLEHMLFKGSKTIGTTDYRAEVPLMEQMERTARRIRDIQITLGAWRYDAFEEYVTRLKTELPDSERAAMASDESAGWKAALDRLPLEPEGLPQEWRRWPWMLKDERRNYWTLYRELLRLRVEMAGLIAKQKAFITESEPLDGIYDVQGARSFNAFTSDDQTTYMVGLPSNCLELWMLLESDRFQNPVFREFYTEREVVMEELRMRSSEAWSMLSEALNYTAFHAHPYGRPTVGLLGDIRLTLRSDMEAHFQRYYGPNNCQMTIVGDVNADEVFRLAKKYFGRWKPKDIASEITIMEPPQNGERRVTVEFDAEPQLLIGWHAPVAPHPDAYALSMLDNVLSSGRTSRFYKSIYLEQGLTSDPPWASAPSSRYDGLFTVGATPKSPHTCAEVEAAIYRELEKLAAEPVTERELERVRNQVKRNELARLRSNQWLAFSLSGAFVNRGDWRALESDFKRLMAVTPQDIQRVVRKYLTPTNRTVATLTKPQATAELPSSTGDAQ